MTSSLITTAPTVAAALVLLSMSGHTVAERAAEGTTCTVTSTDPAQQGECGTADYCTNEGGNLLSSSDCWQAPNRGTPGSGGGGTPAWGCCVSANADQGGVPDGTTCLANNDPTLAHIVGQCQTLTTCTGPTMNGALFPTDDCGERPDFGCCASPKMDWACKNSDDTLFGKCSNAANCDNIAEGLHATDDCGTIGQGGDWGCCLAPIREGPPGF